REFAIVESIASANEARLHLARRVGAISQKELPEIVARQIARARRVSDRPRPGRARARRLRAAHRRDLGDHERVVVDHALVLEITARTSRRRLKRQARRDDPAYDRDRKAITHGSNLENRMAA